MGKGVQFPDIIWTNNDRRSIILVHKVNSPINRLWQKEKKKRVFGCNESEEQ